jgi:hypothetical protein
MALYRQSCRGSRNLRGHGFAFHKGDPDAHCEGKHPGQRQVFTALALELWARRDRAAGRGRQAAIRLSAEP